MENTKRNRVRGKGPKRNQLAIFKKLGEVSDETYEYLNNFLNENTHSDIGTDAYSITRSCDYENVFNVGQKYRQIILQKDKTNNNVTIDEHDYDKWIPGSELAQEEIKRFFKKIYRFRVSEMQPKHSLNWHIDTDTSVICRAQICLNENDSDFLFKDRKGIHKLRMEPKEFWFINTGWPHTVENHTDDVRRVAIMSFDYSDLRKDLQEELKL